jgi:hypothetical protein
MPGDDVKMEPVDVHIVGGEKQTAPDFGVWRSITLAGTEIGGLSMQLLPQEEKRHRAIIIIQPGVAANVLGNVFIGTRAQVQATLPQGGQLVNGNSVVLESASEVWIAADGSHSLTVTVLDERFK